MRTVRWQTHSLCFIHWEILKQPKMDLGGISNTVCLLEPLFNSQNYLTSTQ